MSNPSNHSDKKEIILDAISKFKAHQIKFFREDEFTNRTEVMYQLGRHRATVNQLIQVWFKEGNRVYIKATRHEFDHNRKNSLYNTHLNLGNYNLEFPSEIIELQEELKIAIKSTIYGNIEN